MSYQDSENKPTETKASQNPDQLIAEIPKHINILVEGSYEFLRLITDVHPDDYNEYSEDFIKGIVNAVRALAPNAQLDFKMPPYDEGTEESDNGDEGTSENENNNDPAERVARARQEHEGGQSRRGQQGQVKDPDDGRLKENREAGIKKGEGENRLSGGAHLTRGQRR